jgi:hypothetical protein
MSGLNNFVDSIVNENTMLRTKIETYNKDEEIQKMKEKLSHYMSNSLHIMTDSEKEKRKAFSNKHYNWCKSNYRTILVGTGIGTSVEVQCIKCGASECITDTDNW